MRLLFFFLMALLVLVSTTAFAQAKPPMTIPEDLRYCSADSDCMLVDFFCNTCCDYDAISISGEDIFTDLRKNYCDADEDDICECAEPDVTPACKDNRCVPFNPFADEDGNVSYE